MMGAFYRGRIARAPARIPSAINAGPIASQLPDAARPAVAAQEIDENASAKVATRDDVWRRRKCDRFACLRNQSWIIVAAAAAIKIPDRRRLQSRAP